MVAVDGATLPATMATAAVATELDRVEATRHGREGDGVELMRTLTTNTSEGSVRSEIARGGRNRRRSRTGVEEGNGVVPELHGIPARVTRRRRGEDPGAPS